MSKVTLQDLQKADSKGLDELYSVLYDPIKQIDLSLLYENLQRIEKNITYNRNMDVVASLTLATRDFVLELLPYIVKFCSYAKTNAKKEKGLAFLERSADYFKEKDIKSTDSAKNAYVEMDEDRISARNKEGNFFALYEYLSKRFGDLEDKHNYAKKLLSFDKAAENTGGAPRDVSKLNEEV